jgi:hypothetical protein
MKKIISIILIVLLFLGSTQAGWKNNIKKVGDAAKKTTKGVKKATENTKKQFDKLESPCTRCGKNTRLGKWCADCKKKSIAATGREIGRQGEKVIVSGKKGAQFVGKKYQEYKPHVIKMREATVKKYQEWSPVVQRQYKSTLDKIKDPETRRKATEALVTAVEIKKQIDEAKKKGVYKGISKVTSLRLPEELGGKTLGEEMGERIIKMNPGLAGSGIDEDPAMAITAVLCQNPKYLTHELTFIKRDGRNVSLMESVKMSSPFNSSDTIKGFKVMGAIEKTANCIATGEGGVEALESLGNAMESANK